MTDTSTDNRSTWARELDQVTDEHEGDLVVIEVLDTTYGDGEEAERVPFAYASYDRKDDVVIVGVGGRSGRFPVALRHIIAHPVQIDVAENAMRVVSEDGTTTIVTFVEDSP
jgi:acetamidase/formamidase